MNNVCLTIGRQFGSGGREVASRVAELLGFKYYDKEILSLASEESGISLDIFENVDETRSMLFSDSMIPVQSALIGNFYSFSESMSSDNLFIHKMSVIKKIADIQNAVVVGRCADYILREYENVLSVFIHSNDVEKRKDRVRSRHPEIEEKHLASYIKKADKKRSSYYNYYTDQNWGESKYYDLSVDTSVFGIEAAAQLIVSAINEFRKK